MSETINENEQENGLETSHHNAEQEIESSDHDGNLVETNAADLPESETKEAHEAHEANETHDANETHEANEANASYRERVAPEETEDAADDKAQVKESETKQPVKPRPEDLDMLLEAALLTTDKPLTAAKLAEALGGVPRDIRECVEELNHFYNEYDRTFRIELIAGGYQILTLSQYKDVLLPLQKKRDDSRLTAAALETLSIIAYKQPMIRAEIESIRGVACGEVLKSLMEKRLIKIVGRSEDIGRPMLYGTTKTFLEVFGLANLKDLPNVEKKQDEDD